MDRNDLKKSDKIYWIWLALRLKNLNSVFQGLLDAFGGSAYRVYCADEKQIRAVKHLSEMQIRALLNKDLNEAITIYDYCKWNRVGIMSYGDSIYPEGLKAMKKPPILLYYMGNIPNLNNKLCISVVGTRLMTEYGMRSGYKIAYELASAGAVIVSGMALGIDSVAHAGAIGARGTTVAVLGCGIDVIYPKQHRKLRKHICENGAILTPFHPGTEPFKNNFPERNAIISALSEGTLIIEAPLKSGALITADCAAEQSRTVYALPGSIEEPMSAGPNHLIKNGAAAITCARDVLQYYFENRSSLVDPVRLKHGELSSEFDNGILNDLGISGSCHGKGPKEAPADLLKKLNNQLNNNAEQNSDYYSAPKMKRMNEQSDNSLQRTASAKGNTQAVNELRDVSTVDQSVLDSLSEEQRRIFNDLPCNKPVTVDMIVKNGYGIGTVMATLTILEIKGLVSSLPGGMYIRK